MSLRAIFAKPFGYIALALVLVLGLGVLASVYLSRVPRPPKEIPVAIGTWAGFGNAIVGRDENLFPGMKINLSIVDDPTVLSAGLGNSFMVVQSSMDYAALMLANGLDGQIILVTDESSGGDAIIADPSIKTVADLRGKTVAYTEGPASEWLLVGALAKDGMKLGDIKTKTFVDPFLARDAYTNKEVDALVIWEPLISQATKERPSNRLISSRELPERVFGVLIASTAMLKDKDLTERFLRGWVAADEFRIANPERANKAIAEGLKTPVEDTRAMLDGTKIASRSRNREFFVAEPGSGGTKLNRLLGEALVYWKSKGEAKPDAALASPISDTAKGFFGKP